MTLITYNRGNTKQSNIANCINATYGKGLDRHGQRSGVLQKINDGGQSDRIYSINGISPTISANGGGLGAKTGLYAIPVLTLGRIKKGQNGRRMKEIGEDAFTITSNDPNGVMINSRVRRLTPLECERLQGFPDRWTEGFSDTARYKMLGNAVSVPVVRAVGMKLIDK